MHTGIQCAILACVMTAAAIGPAAAVDCVDWAGDVPLSAELRCRQITAPFVFSGFMTYDGDEFRFVWAVHDLESADPGAPVQTGVDSSATWFEAGGEIIGSDSHRAVWRVHTEGEAATDAVYHGDFTSLPAVVTPLPSNVITVAFADDLLLLVRPLYMEIRATSEGLPVLNQLVLNLDSVLLLDDGFFLAGSGQNSAPHAMYHVDLADPMAPVVRDTFTHGVNLTPITYHDDRLYVRGASSTLMAFDRTDPDDLTLVWYRNGPNVEPGHILGDRCVIYEDGMLKVLDLAAATAPVVIGTIATQGRFQLAPEALYVARYSGDVLEAWDLADPTDPQFIGATIDEGEQVALADGGVVTHRLLTLNLRPRHCLLTGDVPESPTGPGLQAAPNPFNPRTTLRFEMAAAGPVRLEVFDGRGALVRTLVDAELSAGPHAVIWDGRDQRGMVRASGIYLARLEVGERRMSTKLTLVR